MTDYFIQAFIYLLAAVIAVPLAKQLGLGSVLGYLIAGLVIGPVIGIVGKETTTIQHFAEFGVVMMLFLVGMELELKKLWAMKAKLLGLGGLQVGITAFIFMLFAIGFNQVWTVALAVGLVLALSSTAIVLQTLQEKGLVRTEGGEGSFSVLLFQDIAVIPILALIPLLALPELVAIGGVESDGHVAMSLVDGLAVWSHALVVIGAIIFVGIAGHYLTKPIFKYVAKSGLREAFTATSLMLVIGIAALMNLVGLSPALGAFLAGVILADSEFKHELESNLEPFKGLLLGLFFITVGAGIDFEVLINNFALIIGLTFLVMLTKAIILFVLAMSFKLKGSNRWLLTLSLAQAGEFGFVLLAYSTQNHVIPDEIAELLLLVIALSMFLTPLLFIAFEKVILPRFQLSSNKNEEDEITESGKVIVAGVGRFGQIVERMVRANGFNTVALDLEFSQIEQVRKVGIQGYFGDATRPDLIHTAGVEHASLFIVAIDQRDAAVELVRYVKQTYHQPKVLARAFDRSHYYALRDAGADWVVKETFQSSLEMGAEALRNLGLHPFHAEQLKNTFVEREKAHEESLYSAWQSVDDDSKQNHQFFKHFLKMEESILKAMREDRDDKHSRTERGWNPPPKNYLNEIKSEFDNTSK